MKKLIFSFLIFIFSIVTFFSPYFKLAKEELVIAFLDVGQGDAILIKTVDNKYIIIDGGPDDSLMAKIPLIVPPWITEFHAVVLTHADLDHISGINSLISRYSVKNLIFSNSNHNSFANRYFVNMANSLNKISISQNQVLKIGCCTDLLFVWPPNTKEKLDVNESSISFILSYKDFKGFFGGDITKSIEEKIAKEFPIDIDLLKVSHHGSDTSTSKSFLKIMKPEYAVISVGKDNKFGHPHDSVINNLAEQNIKYWPTSEFGSILAKYNGKTLDFDFFK